MKKRWDLKDDIRRRWQLYLMLLLPVVYIIIFCYTCRLGNLICGLISIN